MNINKKLIIGISLSVVLVLSIFLPIYFVIKSKQKVVDNPIIIWGDEDFLNYNFTGEGTKENPYLIENISISTINFEGIYISDTTRHFSIRNCFISAAKTGIYIENVANNTAIISNNTCYGNGGKGIYVVNSDYSLINKNNCSYNKEEGIYLHLSNNSQIESNICESNTLTGIVVTKCINSEIINNKCEKNKKAGIIMGRANYSSILNNILINNEDLINQFDMEDGLMLFYCHFTNISNNYCSNNGDDGISINDSPFTTVINNTSIGHMDRGIGSVSSDNLILNNNTCINNIGNGFRDWYSSNLTISNNKCNENGVGMTFQGTSFINISFNIVQENDGNGIEFVFASGFLSVNITIYHNFIAYNINYGISILEGKHFTIYHNVFINNNLLGASQAYDASELSFWYNEILMEGNYWNDWIAGTYSIAGPSGSVDSYPLASSPF